MSSKSTATVATMGINIGKNSFHVVGLDEHGAIVPRQKWSGAQVEARLANIPRSHRISGSLPRARPDSTWRPP